MGTVIPFAAKLSSPVMCGVFAEGIRDEISALAGRYTERDASMMIGYCRSASRALRVLGHDEYAVLFDSAGEQIGEDWRSTEYVMRSLHARLCCEG
jgi:hypothetical protein